MSVGACVFMGTRVLEHVNILTKKVNCCFLFSLCYSLHFSSLRSVIRGLLCSRCSWESAQKTFVQFEVNRFEEMVRMMSDSLMSIVDDSPDSRLAV